MSEAKTDQWLDWLTAGRDAKSIEIRRRSLNMLLPIRDRVLDAARLQPDDIVLDIGCGEGLLGIGALERLGDKGQVVFSDISLPLLEHTENAINALGADSRSTFVPADIRDLAEVCDESVTVAVARSVLIYVAQREAAFRAIARVLKPKGRLSIYEPVASFLDGAGDDGSFFGWDVRETKDLAALVKASFGPIDQPILTLDPRDLVHAAEYAGLDDVRALVTASSVRHSPGDELIVRQVLEGRPNPNAPTPTEAARKCLGPDQAGRFLESLAAAVREGRGRRRYTDVLLTATKP
ncbi:class I SAM-dependent methyltransferase [Parafrankia elaeagni]|uniref:class I SAM-dependent methyltransferase n=1 Tax=Parafrankia elaeagni TaxID=222534 RepID=UPI0018A86B08|nr:class I SAM-dependent methyltransferase [Parafrankia elaeagni]